MSQNHETKNKLYGHRLQIGASMGVLRLENVSGRSGILIHPGFVPNHTTGCLIPGLSFIPGTPITYTNGILSSSAALDRLIEISKQYQNFILLLK
jgi:hypothetical protein